jgi:transcriptional regulator with XRE-family HTH domain
MNAPTATKALKLTQSQFVDLIIRRSGVKTDAALARVLNIQRPFISRIRNGWRPIGPSFIICVHEATGIPIRDLKDMLGMPSLAIVRSAG